MISNTSSGAGRLPVIIVPWFQHREIRLRLAEIIELNGVPTATTPCRQPPEPVCGQRVRGTRMVAADGDMAISCPSMSSTRSSSVRMPTCPYGDIRPRSEARTTMDYGSAILSRLMPSSNSLVGAALDQLHQMTTQGMIMDIPRPNQVGGATRRHQP